LAGPGAIDKPTVFLSHAETDQPVAQVIHGAIEKVFAGGVEVFASSVPGVLTPGADWLEKVRANLTKATAVIVIVSPISINRPWVWFEVGASWSKMTEGEGTILPLCVPEIDKGALPEPLSRLQAMSLGSAAETKEVFRALIEQFGFGKISAFRHSLIKAKLPKYEDLRIAAADLESGTLYTGPYEGYSQAELELVVDDQIVEPDWEDQQGPFPSGSSIFRGQLLHFRHLDQEHDLPPGTTKTVLEKVVTELYPAKVSHRTENTVRFIQLHGEEREKWDEDAAAEE
jgi:TIR domain